MTTSKFVIVKHDAKRAKLHYDLRFIMPKSKIWASFAVRKGVPEKTGTKVLAVRTHDHTEKEALFFGTIKQGYGAGRLQKWDDGQCIIHKYSTGHIAIEFKGKKIKGLYHMVSTGVMNKKEFKKKSYMLFKGKEPLKEILGLLSRIPTRGLADDLEEPESELTTSPLPWGSTETVTGPSSKLKIREYLNRLNEFDVASIASAAGDTLKWGAANPGAAALATGAGLAIGHYASKPAVKGIDKLHQRACAKRHPAGSPGYKNCMTKGIYGK